MGTFVPAGSSSGPWLCYVNPVPSTPITNTAAETAFDQFFTFPSQSQRAVGNPTVIRIKAYGIYSSGLINLGINLRMRWGGLSGQSILTLLSDSVGMSASNSGWSMEGILTIQGGGTAAAMEVQGYYSFSVGAAGIDSDHLANASTFTIDTTVPSDLVITAQWTIAAAANSIQLRSCIVEVDGP
jgi:hypothetical protein